MKSATWEESYGALRALIESGKFQVADLITISAVPQPGHFQSPAPPPVPQYVLLDTQSLEVVNSGQGNIVSLDTQSLEVVTSGDPAANTVSLDTQYLEVVVPYP